MKTFFTLLFVLALGLSFAVPAPQQIMVELGQPFSLQGADTATFEAMTFSLSSVTVTGDNIQVMVNVTFGEESEGFMLELPAAASANVGGYTLTLQSGSVPADNTALCAVSRATLVLEKTEAAL